MIQALDRQRGPVALAHTVEPPDGLEGGEPQRVVIDDIQQSAPGPGAEGLADRLRDRPLVPFGDCRRRRFQLEPCFCFLAMTLTDIKAIVSLRIVGCSTHRDLSLCRWPL